MKKINKKIKGLWIRFLCSFIGHRLNMLDRIYPDGFFNSSYLPGITESSKPKFKCTRCNKYVGRRVW